MKLEDKMFLTNFKRDEKSHLEVDNEICRNCRERPCLTFCPAGNYVEEEDGKIVVSYEGCFECGTCRIACPLKAIKWSYPRGGFGVCYRFG